MKKLLACLFAFVMLLSMTACGSKEDDEPKKVKESKKDKEIVAAIEMLEETWTDIYEDEMYDEDEGYFEIKNTRVFTMLRNDYEELKDVAYVVDFVVYTDCYGIDAYYVDAVQGPAGGKGGAVAVYRNGDMEVVSNCFIQSACADMAGFSRGEAVKKMDDYGDEYNCKKILK